MSKSRGLILVALLAAAWSCDTAPGVEKAVPVRVENPDLGIAIATLPPPFEVTTAAGETIDLATPGNGNAGRVVIAAGPPEDYGINLVEEVKARKTAFESAPGGEYFGNRELGTPIGTAFTARGTYQTGNGAVEEIWVYAIHPHGNRLLTITYTYPTGQSQERVQQLMELLGEIEGLPPDQTAPAG